MFLVSFLGTPEHLPLTGLRNLTDSVVLLIQGPCASLCKVVHPVSVPFIENNVFGGLLNNSEDMAYIKSLVGKKLHSIKGQVLDAAKAAMVKHNGLAADVAAAISGGVAHSWKEHTPVSDSDLDVLSNAFTPIVDLFGDLDVSDGDLSMSISAVRFMRVAATLSVVYRKAAAVIPASNDDQEVNISEISPGKFNKAFGAVIRRAYKYHQAVSELLLYREEAPAILKLLEAESERAVDMLKTTSLALQSAHGAIVKAAKNESEKSDWGALVTEFLKTKKAGALFSATTSECEQKVKMCWTGISEIEGLWQSLTDQIPEHSEFFKPLSADLLAQVRQHVSNIIVITGVSKPLPKNATRQQMIKAARDKTTSLQLPGESEFVKEAAAAATAATK